MRLAILAFTCALAIPAAQPEAAPAAAPAAQHEATHEGAGEAGKHGEPGHTEAWKWANFLLLAGVIGYFIGKNAGPFFSERSRQIRKDMVESEEQRREAEAKAAEVDRRLGNLEAEIASLRQEAQQEQAAEAERVSRHTEAEIAKIQQHAEQEIDSAGKAARTELKRYSAQLAVELAEQKIRVRITPEAQDALVRGFVRDLESPEKFSR